MRRRLHAIGSVCRLAPWFLGFGIAKRFVALPTLARWAYRTPARSGGALELHRLASMVLLTGRLTGAPDRDCLQRSLVLYRELSSAGMRPLLSLGFKRAAAGLTGHAWVSVEGMVVAEPDLDATSFTHVVTFGAGGVLVNPADQTPDVAA